MPQVQKTYKLGLALMWSRKSCKSWFTSLHVLRPNTIMITIIISRVPTAAQWLFPTILGVSRRQKWKHQWKHHVCMVGCKLTLINILSWSLHSTANLMQLQSRFPRSGQHLECACWCFKCVCSCVGVQWKWQLATNDRDKKDKKRGRQLSVIHGQQIQTGDDDVGATTCWTTLTDRAA